MTSRLCPKGALLVPLLLLASAWSEISTLQPVSDTTLFELAPEHNLGAVASLPAGTINQGKRCRLLVRFDLASAVPAGAQILAASLTVTVQRASGPDSVFELHRMLWPWNEGTKAGDTNAGEPATEGEVTWAHRSHPQVPWTAAGGLPGSDFVAEPTSSTLLAAPGDYSFANGPKLVADVQQWLDHPDSNHGWMLLTVDESSPGTSRRIASREDPAGGTRLVLEWVPPEMRPRFERIVRVGDDVHLHFPIEAGKLYAVEYTPALLGADWAILTHAASKFTPTNWVAADSIHSGLQRTYRLAILGDID